MKLHWLLIPLVLNACTPSANNRNNNPRDITAPVGHLPDEGEKGPTDVSTPPPLVTLDPDPVEPGKIPDTELQLKDCHNSGVTGSAHSLAVEMEENTAQYRITFAHEADQALQVISLYVTDKDDAIPIFPRFDFSGTAYWMVSVDNPFDDFFELPVRYGMLPDKGVDVTEHYKGMAQGANLSSLVVPTCLKFSVITFEPESDEAFKTSIYFMGHRP